MNNHRTMDRSKPLRTDTGAAASWGGEASSGMFSWASGVSVTLQNKRFGWMDLAWQASPEAATDYIEINAPGTKEGWSYSSRRALTGSTLVAR
jgi:hypothetical protein